MDEGFGGVDRRLVHHLHAAGNDAGADDIGDALAGRLHFRETDHQRPRRLRLLQDAHGDFGDDAEQAFRAGDDAHHVVAGGFRRFAADLDDLARDQHDLAAQHVVGGHAVFQAVHAAGIFRDIAADRAGDLRRGIRRVIKPGMRDRLADGEVGDAGLGHHHAVVEIDLADALEFAEAQQHGVRKRQRAAGQRGAGAARHHLDALLEAIFQHLRDLLGGVRQHHHHRRLAIGHQAIGFVRDHLGGTSRSRPRPARSRANPPRCCRGGREPPDPTRASIWSFGHTPRAHERSILSHGNKHVPMRLGRSPNRRRRPLPACPPRPAHATNGVAEHPATDPRNRSRAFHETTDPEHADRHRIRRGILRRAGAGCRRRQDLLQQVPGLPRHRRRRQKQGRSGTQRTERTQIRHRGGLFLFRANKNSGITWDEATFKDYIKDPKAKIPGTKMVFAGIKNEQEASDLWAFLAQYDKDGKTKRIRRSISID